MIFGAIDPTIGIVTAAVVTGLVTYLVAARGLSGKIKNTDAQELWAESRSIREWSMSRVKELDEHINRLEARLVEVEKRNTSLAEENRRLQEDLYRERNLVLALQTQNATLENQLEDCNQVIKRLKWEAEHAPRRRASDPPITDEEEIPNAGKPGRREEDDRRGS